MGRFSERAKRRIVKMVGGREIDRQVMAELALHGLVSATASPRSFELPTLKSEPVRRSCKPPQKHSFRSRDRCRYCGMRRNDDSKAKKKERV
jgi:hypothetical protein